MKSGIYSIYCKATDKYYVGQSLDIEERLKYHLSRLRNNKHKNELLQSDFNKYGEDAFITKVEKYIEPQFLSSLETHFMEFYNSINNGYNINNTKVIIRKEDKDRQLSGFLEVLVSYHGISKLTIAKMAGVEENDIDRLLANPPEKIEIEVKYKIAVTVMELRFWLKDCESPI